MIYQMNGKHSASFKSALSEDDAFFSINGDKINIEQKGKIIFYQ